MSERHIFGPSHAKKACAGLVDEGNGGEGLTKRVHATKFRVGIFDPRRALIVDQTTDKASFRDRHTVRQVYGEPLRK